MSPTASPWKALLWKEWREVRLVVGLTFLAILLAAVRDLTPRNYYINLQQGFYVFMQNAFPVVVVASGFLLGLLQILRDIRADTWGLCVHRAVSRHACFQAKVLVGGGALVGAWSLSTLLVAGWCVWPGVPGAPFLPEFLLLSVGVQALGLTAYAAGLAIAAGNGRWWFSRWLPLFPMLVLLAISYELPLWLVTLLGMGCAAGLILGARAFWLSGPGGTVRRGGWLTTGPTWVAAFFLAIALIGLIDDRDRLSALRVSRQYDYDSWSIDAQGRPLLRYSRQGLEQTVDEHGVVLAENTNTGAPRGWIRRAGELQPLDIWTVGRRYRLLDTWTDGAGWQFHTPVALPTRAEVLLYDWTGRQASWQTPDGPLRALSGRITTPGVVAGASTVWRLKEGRASILFRAAVGEQILSDTQVPAEGKDIQPLHLIRTDRRVVVVRPGQADQTLAVTPEDSDGTFYVLADGRVATLRTTGDGASTIETLTTFAVDGSIQSERPLSRPPGIPAPKAEKTPLPKYVAMFPVPVLVPSAHWEAERGVEPLPWPVLAFSALLHLLAVVVVIWWSRRHQATTATTWRWAVLTGLAGWPSLLVFFVHADLTHLVTCATCGRKRALSAEQCGACGAPWPAQPQLDQQGFAFEGDLAAVFGKPGRKV